MKPSKPIASSRRPPLQPSPPEAPRDLAALQRVMAQAVMRPLDPAERMQRRWTDDTSTSSIVETFIKPNDRLTAFDRLEIYNRQYWFRLLDCLHEDFPGLRYLLGSRRFLALSIAYLTKHPSTSPNLRDLGSRLVQFLHEEPAVTAPYETLCLDMARLEWAQIVAFDSAKKRSASLQSLAGLSPDRIFFRLQPYITLLDLAYPVEKTIIRLLRQDDGLRRDASNAVESATTSRQRSLAHTIKPAPTRLLVHRQQNAVYFKPLLEPQHLILSALDRGLSLTAALELAAAPMAKAGLTAEHLQTWFQSWAALGFLVLVSKT